MKLKTTIMLSLSVLTTSTLFASNDGAAIFDTKCASCHIKTRPTAQMRNTLIAPPIMGVMRHVKDTYGNDKEKAVAFIKDYVMNPSQEKAVCIPQSIQRFGLMPSQKGLLTPKELDKVADYIYDNFPFQGMGRGMMNPMRNN